MRHYQILEIKLLFPYLLMNISSLTQSITLEITDIFNILTMQLTMTNLTVTDLINLKFRFSEC